MGVKNSWFFDRRSYIKFFCEFFYTSRSALGRPKVRTDEQSGMSASVCQTPATDSLDSVKVCFSLLFLLLHFDLNESADYILITKSYFNYLFWIVRCSVTVILILFLVMKTETVSVR